MYLSIHPCNNSNKWRKMSTSIRLNIHSCIGYCVSTYIHQNCNLVWFIRLSSSGCVPRLKQPCLQTRWKSVFVPRVEFAHFSLSHFFTSLTSCYGKNGQHCDSQNTSLQFLSQWQRATSRADGQPNSSPGKYQMLFKGSLVPLTSKWHKISQTHANPLTFQTSIC